MLELAFLAATIWFILAKAVYDEISAKSTAARWKIACFASIGPPIILWGIATRWLRKA